MRIPANVAAAPRKVASNFSQIYIASGVGFAGASGAAWMADQKAPPDADGTSIGRTDRVEAREAWTGVRSNTFVISTFVAGLMIGSLYPHTRRVLGSPELAARAAGGRALLDVLQGNPKARAAVADAVIDYARENPAFAGAVAEAVERGGPQGIADAARAELALINPREVTIMRNIYGASAGSLIAAAAAPSWLPPLDA